MDLESIIHQFEEKVHEIKLKKINVVFQKLLPDDRDFISLICLDDRLNSFREEEAESLSKFFSTFVRQTGKNYMSRKYFYLNLMAAANQNKFGINKMLHDDDIQEIQKSLNNIRMKNNCKQSDPNGSVAPCPKSSPVPHVQTSLQEVLKPMIPDQRVKEAQEQGKSQFTLSGSSISGIPHYSSSTQISYFEDENPDHHSKSIMNIDYSQSKNLTFNPSNQFSDASRSLEEMHQDKNNQKSTKFINKIGKDMNRDNIIKGFKENFKGKENFCHDFIELDNTIRRIERTNHSPVKTITSQSDLGNKYFSTNLENKSCKLSQNIQQKPKETTKISYLQPSTTPFLNNKKSIPQINHKKDQIHLTNNNSISNNNNNSNSNNKLNPSTKKIKRSISTNECKDKEKQRSFSQDKLQFSEVSTKFIQKKQLNQQPQMVVDIQQRISQSRGNSSGERKERMNEQISGGLENKKEKNIENKFIMKEKSHENLSRGKSLENNNKKLKNQMDFEEFKQRYQESNKINSNNNIKNEGIKKQQNQDLKGKKLIQKNQNSHQQNHPHHQKALSNPIIINQLHQQQQQQQQQQYQNQMISPSIIVGSQQTELYQFSSSNSKQTPFFQKSSCNQMERFKIPKPNGYSDQYHIKKGLIQKSDRKGSNDIQSFIIESNSRENSKEKNHLHSHHPFQGENNEFMHLNQNDKRKNSLPFFIHPPPTPQLRQSEQFLQNQSFLQKEDSSNLNKGNKMAKNDKDNSFQGLKRHSSISNPLKVDSPQDMKPKKGINKQSDLEILASPTYQSYFEKIIMQDERISKYFTTQNDEEPAISSAGAFMNENSKKNNMGQKVINYSSINNPDAPPKYQNKQILSKRDDNSINNQPQRVIKGNDLRENQKSNIELKKKKEDLSTIDDPNMLIQIQMEQLKKIQEEKQKLFAEEQEMIQQLANSQLAKSKGNPISKVLLSSLQEDTYQREGSRLERRQSKIGQDFINQSNAYYEQKKYPSLAIENNIKSSNEKQNIILSSLHESNSNFNVIINYPENNTQTTNYQLSSYSSSKSNQIDPAGFVDSGYNFTSNAAQKYREEDNQKQQGSGLNNNNISTGPLHNSSINFSFTDS